MCKKYLPVEVKLLVDVNTIKQQLNKYCMDDEIIIDSKNNRIVTKNNIYSNRVLVIDTFNVYMYKYEDDGLSCIYDLNNLNSDEDIHELKDIIEKLL